MTISWSPPGRLCSTVHSSVASTPSSRGLPVGPGWCATPSQAAASPRRAKFAESSCCGADSTFTTNAPWLRIASRVRLFRSKQTRMSGGSSDSELTALAVVPTGSPSGPTEVTTVTPVAKWPMARRNSSLVRSISVGVDAVIVMSVRGWPRAHYCASSFRCRDISGRPDHDGPECASYASDG